MAISIHDFAKLLLAKLAENTLVINFYDLSEKHACISFNYLERIESILRTNNGWREEFSVLIDIQDYFEDRLDWEERLARELLLVTEELGKKMTFDFVHGHFSVIFKEDEIGQIYHGYDSQLVEVMSHFANLMLHDTLLRHYLKKGFPDSTDI